MFESRKNEGIRMGADKDDIVWVTSEEEVRAIKTAMANL